MSAIEGEQAKRSEPTAKKKQAFEQIRREIISRKREPGSFISAKGLAKDLNISRTPVREAMEVLARDGLIDLVGGAGAKIREVNEEALAENLTLRRAIEIEVCLQLSSVLSPYKQRVLDDLLAEMKRAVPAAKRDKTGPGMEAFYDLDVKFHRTNAALAGMSRAEAYIVNLMDHFRLFALEGMMDPAKILGDHKAIVEALKEKNPDLIRAAVTKHFRGTIERRAPRLIEWAIERWGMLGSKETEESAAAGRSKT